MHTRNFGAKDWKEQRRWQALKLHEAGWSQTMIAQALGVSKAAVSQWFSGVEEEGKWALCSRLRPGASPRLSRQELRLIPDCLSHGAEAYGFLGELWTSGRIASVIEWEFGVRYHKRHVSRLLKELNWSPQKPMLEAQQRDEQEIERWRTEQWPGLKKSPKRRKDLDSIG